MSSNRRHDLFVLGLIFLVPIVLFADVLFLGAGFYDRDLSTYHWPMRTIVRNALLAGEFPQWNPFHLNGQPMAANPAYELFYPPQLLILLPDFLFGFQALLLFHLFLALGGMYLFLRSLNIARAAAAFGAIAFGLSGPLLSTVNLNPTFFSFAWFPLVLLNFRQFVLHRRMRNGILTVLFLVLILVICEPVSVLEIGFLMLGYVLHRSISDGGLKTFTRSAVVLGSICVLAATIAAVQLLPAVDLGKDSVRSDGLVREEALAWSTPPLRLLEMFYANVFGPLVENGGFYWGADLYGIAQGPFIRCIYPGALVGLLAVAALWHRVRGAKTYLLAMPVIFLVSFGDHTPLGNVLYEAGVFRSIRYPEKWMLLAIFPLFIFAARGFELLLHKDARFSRTARTIAIILSSVAATLALLTRLPQYPQFFHSFWRISSDAVLPQMLAISRYEWIVATSFALAALLLVALRQRLSSTVWIGAAFLIVALDLGTIVDALMPRMPSSFFQSPPIAIAARSVHRQPRLFHTEASTAGNADAGKYGALGGNRYWVVRNAMAGLLPLASGIRTSVGLDVDATSLLPTARFEALIAELTISKPPQWRERVADVARTNLRAEWRPFEPEMKRIDGDFPSIQPMALIVDRDRAAVYFASAVIPIASDDDFRKTFLTGAIQHDVVAAEVAAEIGAMPPQRGVVSAVRESWDTIDIDVRDVEGPAFLVIAATPHRYWRATVDGRATPIAPANLISSGVVLAKGAREIRLRYSNPVLRLGAIVSIIALLLSPLVLSVLRRILPPADTSYEPEDVPEHPRRITQDVDTRVVGVVPEHRNL